MDFIWECMVLAVKVSVGGFFWSLAIGIPLFIIGLIFGGFKKS